MSKSTLALIAAASAATGAAATAAFYSSKERRPAASASAAAAAQSATAPPAAAPGAKYTVPSGAQLAGAAPVNPSGVFQYGFPGPVADLHPTSSTTSSLDRRTRNPHWVAEHITAASLSMRNGDRKHSYFAEDGSVPHKFRARLADYAHSGYDRGHQVPAADAKWSQQAMDHTFLLTNMCPQVGDGFNRDYWAHFEDFCRRLTNTYPSVRIVTGPLYLPARDERDGKWRVSYEVIGNPPNVAVPTHFYKVIFAEDGKTGGDVSLGAFVLPNKRIDNDKPLGDFEVPLEAIERASGLEFAAKLPPHRTKKLCQEVSCSLVVRQYADRQRNLAGKPPGPSPSPLA